MTEDKQAPEQINTTEDTKTEQPGQVVKKSNRLFPRSISISLDDCEYLSMIGSGNLSRGVRMIVAKHQRASDKTDAA